VDPKELVNLYLDIADSLLSKLALNNSKDDDSDQYLFVLSIEQSLDALADSIAASINFNNSDFSSYEYQKKWIELSSNSFLENIIKNEFSPNGLFNDLKQVKKMLHEPVNDSIIVSNETLSLKKFNLLLNRYKEFIIILRKSLEEC
jgi:hypothetical protein